MISEIPRSEYGLETVAEAANRRRWAVRSVQNWIMAGLLRVVCAAEGRRGVYLLRIKDVDAFTPPLRGRPPVKESAKGKPARKPKAKK